MPSAKLYQVRLAARVEALRDLVETLARFQAGFRDRSRKRERHHTLGFVGSLAYEQADIDGVYIPDYDVTDLSLRVFVRDESEALRALSAVVKRFVDCAKQVTDTHVLRQSLDFRECYTGKRDTNITFTPDGILVDLAEHIECLA